MTAALLIVVPSLYVCIMMRLKINEYEGCIGKTGDKIIMKQALEKYYENYWLPLHTTL